MDEAIEDSHASQELFPVMQLPFAAMSLIFHGAALQYSLWILNNISHG
jgi:hypothetical protein